MVTWRLEAHSTVNSMKELMHREQCIHTDHGHIAMQIEQEVTYKSLSIELRNHAALNFPKSQTRSSNSKLTNCSLTDLAQDVGKALALC